MKELLKVAALFALLLAAIPMLTFLKPRENITPPLTAKAAGLPINAENAVTDTAETESLQETEPAKSASENEQYEPDTLKVLDFTSGQVMELSLRDYVIGAVLAEMPASYHEEALKAQAVAARTYAVRQREKQSLSPDPELMGADISNDSTKYQAYFTPEQAKSFYGSGYEVYLEKASAAVDATGSDVLVYGGEPIVAAFHSTSGGKTESAEVVWGSPVDYLVPVDSSEDEKSPSYLEENTFTEAELKARLETALEDADFSGDPEDWLKIEERSASGTVTKMTAGDAELTGADFRRIFSLRSANFTIEYSAKGENFSVTTKGSGHGVGMSQYGANAMANDGSDYREILLYYYGGAEIADMNDITY
ncbi:MAG: stage II sporulation protein D [Oscillospiraceae bacterium]|nr:stage II sporulation protein D [Oscillospiraceae bacterium]